MTVDSDFVEESEKFLEKNKKDEEPAVRTGLTTGSVAAVISGVLYLFPDITESQLRVILIIACLIVPAISAFRTRSKAWSSASVNRLIRLKG